MSTSELDVDQLFPLPPAHRPPGADAAARDRVPRAVLRAPPLVKQKPADAGAQQQRPASASAAAPARPSYVYSNPEKPERLKLPPASDWAADIRSPELLTSITLTATDESNVKLQARLMYEMTQNKILTERVEELLAKLFEKELAEQRLAAAELRIGVLEEALKREQQRTPSDHRNQESDRPEQRGGGGGGAGSAAATKRTIPKSTTTGTLCAENSADAQAAGPSFLFSSEPMETSSSAPRVSVLTVDTAEAEDGGGGGASSGRPPDGAPAEDAADGGPAGSESDMTILVSLHDGSSSPPEASDARSAKSVNLESSLKKKGRVTLSGSSLKKGSAATISAAFSSAAAKMMSKSSGILNECRSPASATAHRFQPVTGGLPVGKCNYCDHMFWAAGNGDVMKCAQCGEKFHEECAEKMPPNCGSKDADDAASAKSRTKSSASAAAAAAAAPAAAAAGSATEVYGVALKPDGEVPYVVTACVQAIERRGLTEEGIYRIPGRKVDIDKLRAQFNGGRPDLDNDEQWHDVNSVAGALKLYFRELPEPLMTSRLYPEFVAAGTRYRGDELKQAMIPLVSQLPSANRKILSFLVRHLKSVAAKGAINKMYESNLAMVFGATLCPEKDLGSVTHISGLCNVVEIMIRECDEIFRDE